MSKIKNKYIIIFVMTIVIAMSLIHNVYAAGSFTVKTSVSSVSSKGSFKVTVTAKNAAGQFKATVSNGSGGSTFWLDNSSTTFNITAGSEGTVKVTVTAVDVSDTDTEKSITGSKSVSVSIKSSSKNTNTQTDTNKNTNTSTNTQKEETLSKDNTLSSLTVSEGTLSPKFSASITKYSVDVSGDTSSITLSAKAKDAKAKVTGIGKKTLKIGKNSFDIKCTAENGGVKTYTIEVNVDETPVVYTTYHDQKLGVVRNLENIGVPASFEKTSVKLDNQEITAYHSNQMNKTIVYMVDEDNHKNFYLYEDGQLVSLFKPITLLGRNVYQIDVNENDIQKEYMIFKELTIDKNQLMGWTYEDPSLSQYSLIIVMNEQGEKVIYQYEKSEDSLQLYLDPDLFVKEEAPNYKYLFMGVSGLLLVVCLGLIVYIQRYKHKSIASIKAYYERRNRE